MANNDTTISNLASLILACGTVMYYRPEGDEQSPFTDLEWDVFMVWVRANQHWLVGQKKIFALVDPEATTSSTYDLVERFSDLKYVQTAADREQTCNALRTLDALPRVLAYRREARESLL